MTDAEILESIAQELEEHYCSLLASTIRDIAEKVKQLEADNKAHLENIYQHRCT